MRTPSRWFTLAGLVVAAGCSDAPTGPSSIQRPLGADASDPPHLGVGAIGVVVDVKPNDRQLVIEQIGPEYVAPPGARHGEVRHEFAVGHRRNRLQVHVRKDTSKIYLRDKERGLDSVKVGDTLLVVGQVTGSSLHVDMITDVRRVDRADSTIAKLPKGSSVMRSSARTFAMAPASVTSLCMGQDLDYAEANVLEFQGCWGGPNASDDLNTPFIPLFCPLVGCVGIDRFSYTLALGGWSYAFPFRFRAEANPGLVYHVPGVVTLGMDTLPATVGSFSFSGGLGMDFGLNLDFCSFFGCYDMFTVHLSAFSMIHQATGAGPIDDGARMEIAETSCPAIGFFPIQGVPIDPLSIGFCEDLGLNGRPFNATVTSIGASPAVWSRRAFSSARQTATIRPDAMQVGVRFDDFAWSPYLTMGLYFRFKIFQVPVWDTPTIPFGEIGAFDAVTTPFPAAGSVFTVATDPLSPANDLRYLYQPTSTSASLAVAPAPTVLAFTSPAVLVEGTPVTVRLTEQYDGTPIVGHSVALQATGLYGTPSAALTATTNASGIASFALPVGEYQLAATYAGATTYVPSSAQQAPVYVYRPTTFVIWGGNAGGIVAGARHQFWGQGWTSQVTGGAWGGNASFQGFAIATSATSWASPPASSARGPESVPALIGVIVTTAAEERGARTTGNVSAHAIVRVDDPASYRPDGGHRAWGVVRMLLP